MTNLEQFIAKVPNFPKDGIMFYDISPLLQQKFTETIDELSNLLTPQEWAEIDHVVGVESRGFLFASALAYKHGKGMSLIRKKGKLPNVAASVSYGLEYGEDVLEMQKGQGNILLIDDVFATGGTLAAAVKAAEQTGYTVKDIAVLINLKSLNDGTCEGHSVKTVFNF